MSVTTSIVDCDKLSFALALMFASIAFIWTLEKVEVLGVNDPYLEYALSTDGPIKGLAKSTVYFRLVADFQMELLKVLSLTAIAVLCLDEFISGRIPKVPKLKPPVPPVVPKQSKCLSPEGNDEYEDEEDGHIHGLVEHVRLQV